MGLTTMNKSEGGASSGSGSGSSSGGSGLLLSDLLLFPQQQGGGGGGGSTDIVEFLLDNDTTSSTPFPNDKIMGDLMSDFDKASTTANPYQSPPLEVSKLSSTHQSLQCRPYHYSFQAMHGWMECGVIWG